MRDAKKGKKVRTILWLILTLGLMVFIFGKFYFRFKSSPFAFLGRVNLVLANNEGEVIVLSLQGDEGLILRLPEREKVEVVRGFGEYELRHVYSLGDLEKKGGLLLRETVQENFSLPIFGYLYNSNGEILDYKSKKHFLLLFWRAFQDKTKTDLTKYDLVLLFLRSMKLKRILNISNDRIGIGISEYFKDRIVRGEKLSIEVLNSTSYNGLAQRVAQLLQNSGARVVRVASDARQQRNCLLSTTREISRRYTFFWLRQIFSCRVEFLEQKNDRADFTLIVGDDFWKKLHEKW